MKLADLISVVGSEAVFASGMLMTAGVTRGEVELQLSRWVRAGKLLRLRRGVYCLAEPYRKTHPHPFEIANRLRAPSYVSLQSALEYYGMIPEAAPTVTSVTTGRPERVATPLGRHIFRHLKKPLFREYARMEVERGRTAFVAKPEKALLDLIYLTPHGDDEAWLAELRLQNLESLDEGELTRMARAGGSAKLARAVQWIVKMRAEETRQTP
jgi:predicted transcriptional regulator of viral defense system